MFYQEITPDISLNPYIDMYAVLYDEKIYQDYHTEKVPSRLCEGLVFYYTPERPLMATTVLACEWLQSGLLLPRVTRIKSWKYKNGMNGFVVVFRPGKFRWLFPFPMLECMNHALTFDGVKEKPMLAYYYQIIKAKSTEERVDISNECILKRAELMDGKKEITKEAIKLIYADLQLHISSISAYLEMTDRHFRRVFSSDMGMQPKQFQKLVRISSSIDKLDKLKKGNTTDIAYECGFFDQSHFINTFKELTRITPMQYLNKNKAKYFVEKLKKKMVFEKKSLRMSVFSYFS